MGHIHQNEVLQKLPDESAHNIYTGFRGLRNHLGASVARKALWGVDLNWAKETERRTSDKERLLAQGCKRLWTLLPVAFATTRGTIRWNPTSPSLQRTHKEGHMLKLNFPTLFEVGIAMWLVLPNKKWGDLCHCQAYIFRAGVWLSICLPLHHQGNTGGGGVSMWSMPLLFREYFARKYVLFLDMSLALWLTKWWCDEVITKWWELGCNS